MPNKFEKYFYHNKGRQVYKKYFGRKARIIGVAIKSSGRL